MNHRDEILWQSNVPRFGKSAIFCEPKCSVFIATGIAIGTGAAAATVGAVATIAAATIGTGVSLYGVASKPGGPQQTAGGLNVNQMQTIIQSAQAEKAKRDKLKAKLAAAQAASPPDAALIADLTAKLATSEAAVVKWRAEINAVKQNAGVAPVDLPEKETFSSPATVGSGSSGSGFSGGSGTPSAVASTLSGADPRMIIGLVLVAAIGGGVWLAKRKKKGK